MPTVTQAVEELVRATVGLSDSDMGRPWVWREYDEEGLRFTLLLAQHELRDLAVRLESLRARKGPPQSQTERILGQYHLAYRDLAGVLAGLRDDDLDRVPAVSETRLPAIAKQVTNKTIATAQQMNATGAADPKPFATNAGRTKIPAPIVELTMFAVSPGTPIARMSW